MENINEIKWDDGKLNLNSIVEVKNLEKDVATEINELKNNISTELEDVSTKLEDISTAIEKFTPKTFAPKKYTFETKVSRPNGFSQDKKFGCYRLESNWDLLRNLNDGQFYLLEFNCSQILGSWNSAAARAVLTDKYLPDINDIETESQFNSSYKNNVVVDSGKYYGYTSNSTASYSFFLPFYGSSKIDSLYMLYKMDAAAYAPISMSDNLTLNLYDFNEWSLALSHE